MTAGGRLPRALRSYADSPVKALLELNGQSLLTTAVAAAQECQAVERIAVVGGSEVEAACPANAEYVHEGEDVVDNIHNAFRHLGGEEHNYLVLSPDLPFITGAAVDRFIGLARGQCEIGAPVVTSEDFLASYPGAPNRFELIDDRRVTMGSCLYITGRVMQKNFPLFRDIYRCRKLPHRIAVMLGFSIIWAFLIGRLSMEALERRASTLTDAVCRGILMDDASIAYDVDNLQNYQYAVQLIREQQS